MKRKTFCILALFLLLVSLPSCKYKRTVASRSMIPTLNMGDVVEYSTNVNNITYGDLIICDLEHEEAGVSLSGPAPFRIMGMPGDSIAVENDICIINGKKNKFKLVGKAKFDEEYKEYADPANEYEEETPNGNKIRIYTNFGIPNAEVINENMKAIKIPNGHYFLMSDYRNMSIDSRHFGTAPIEKIVAKITKIHKK